MSQTILDIQDLTVHYVIDGVPVEAVNGLNLKVDKGECLGLVGETGAGKTTTALAIMGLVPNPPGKIKSGKVIYNGVNLIGKSTKELRKIRGNAISMIFQDPMTSLNPVIKIGDQITEVIRLHKKISENSAVLESQKMLELVGIPASRYEEYPHQFSGGMKQRVMIACALACNPQLLIADEPTTALDVTIQAQVIDLIKNLIREFNTSMLMITHDLAIGSEIFDKVAVMYAGRVIEYGRVRDVYDKPMHPYTQGLLKAIPDLYIDTDHLDPIPGLMPDPSNLPRGCSFSPRCPFCNQTCNEHRPEEIEVENGHWVSCFLTSGKGV